MLNLRSQYIRKKRIPAVKTGLQDLANDLHTIPKMFPGSIGLLIRRQARAEQRLYNNAKKSGNSTHAHLNDYRAARKSLHKSLKSARENYISDYLGEAIEKNPECFDQILSN